MPVRPIPALIRPHTINWALSNGQNKSQAQVKSILKTWPSSLLKCCPIPVELSSQDHQRIGNKASLQEPPEDTFLHIKLTVSKLLSSSSSFVFFVRHEHNILWTPAPHTEVSSSSSSSSSSSCRYETLPTNSTLPRDSAQNHLLIVA